MLAGSGVREALRELLRRGTEGRRGLEDLRRSVRERLRSARTAGSMDGTLQEVRELLDKALEAERRELFPDPDDGARLAEAELDALPEETAGAVRALKDYPWRSPEARQAYAQIQDLLRREVLDSSFASMKQALQNAGDAEMQAVKDMVADLSQLIDAHNRGEDTDQQFRDFMDKHGQFFPDDPQSIEELIDSLARRAAAQERMMAGLSAEQRAELGDLMAQAMSDMGLASEMSHLQDALRQARPDLPWGQRGQVPDGEQALGMGDATTAVAELADLEALSSQLSQGYAGASIADIDEELLERALGRPAVDDLAALRQLERELERQGYLNREGGKLQLSPKAVRRLGATALRRVFAKLSATGRGEHDVTDAGAAGELTGSSREWRFGDEQPLDVVRTVKNAVLRTAGSPRTEHAGCASPSTTSRWWRPSAGPAPPSPCSWTCRTPWRSRHVGRGEVHGDGAALAGHDPLPAGRDPDHRVLLHRPGAAPGDAGRAVGGHAAGHQPAARPDAGAPLPGPAPGRRARGARGHRRRAHRAPGGRRHAVLLLAPDARDDRPHGGGGGTRGAGGATVNVFALDPDPSLVRFVHDLTARAGGRSSSPAPTASASTWWPTTCGQRRGRRSRCRAN